MIDKARSWLQRSLLFAAALCFAGVGAFGVAPALAGGGPGDVIVIFREGVGHQDKEKAVRKAGAALRFNYVTLKAAAAHAPTHAELVSLASDPDVVAVIPDRPVEAHGKKPPGGGTSGAQVVPAGVKRVGAAPGSLAWTGSGVGVAVVDTGIDFAHADLTPVASACYTAFTLSCQDDHGHGTHVSGIIGARDNTIDVVGVAPEVTLYAVKVLDRWGTGSDSTVMAGLEWVALNWDLLTPEIRVVNLSLGRPGSLDDNPALRAAIQHLHDLGIAVVVSAGNDSSRQVSEQVPATYPEVMAVASTTAARGSEACPSSSIVIGADTASYYTTDGKYDATTGIGVTISAPGEEAENVTAGCDVTSAGILSTRLGGGTTRLSGTSMSAPHVTGVIGLMWEKALTLGTTLDPEAARAVIRRSASRAGHAPFNSPTVGYSFDGEREGIVSAPGALR